MFGEVVNGLRNQNIPMSAGASVTRPKESDIKLNVEDQRQYRSGVGMLLYMVKHSRHDISNAVRELSKVMDGATDHHMTMLLRLIKFVIQTTDRGIRIKPQKKDEVVAFDDSDFAGDEENRRSVTGYIIYLYNVPVAWKSCQQGAITLSNSEAEYYAKSEVGAELKFVKMILEFFEIELHKLMTVYVDNIGANHLANNASTGNRTKHIDTRIHYVRELTQGEDVDQNI
jgi:hypothetical protein